MTNLFSNLTLQHPQVNFIYSIFFFFWCFFLTVFKQAKFPGTKDFAYFLKFYKTENSKLEEPINYLQNKPFFLRIESDFSRYYTYNGKKKCICYLISFFFS